MEYGVFGSDKQKLFAAIQAASKVPVQWPFLKVHPQESRTLV
ncbi:hypothetical protein [Archangium violaceum]